MEHLYHVNDMRKFCKKVNRLRKGYVPQNDICRDVCGNLLTNEREMIDRWKQFFDQQLNGDLIGNEGGMVTLCLLSHFSPDFSIF